MEVIVDYLILQRDDGVRGARRTKQPKKTRAKG
jgi:hypothetical protein